MVSGLPSSHTNRLTRGGSLIDATDMGTIASDRSPKAGELSHRESMNGRVVLGERVIDVDNLSELSSLSNSLSNDNSGNSARCVRNFKFSTKPIISFVFVFEYYFQSTTAH